MAPPPISHEGDHPASAPIPLAQRAEVAHRRTSNLHATVGPLLCSVDGPSHKRRRIDSVTVSDKCEESVIELGRATG